MGGLVSGFGFRKGHTAFGGQILYDETAQLVACCLYYRVFG